jgi:hypothetical protein
VKLLALVVLLVGALPAAIGPTFDDVRAAGPGSVQELDSARGAQLDEGARAALLERWNRLTPDVQARMRARFDRYQALSDEDQQALAARTRRIQARAELYYTLFSPEERARLDRLTPEKKREILIALATEEEEEQAVRLRGSLPPELAVTVGEARPEHRRAILDELKRRQEEQLGPAIERFGLELGMDAKVVDRLKRLPIDQRKRKFLELAKTLSTEHITERELPPGLTASRWEIMRELEPEEFFAALMRLRAVHPEVAWLPGDERAAPREHGPYEELRQTMARIRAAGRLSEEDLLGLTSLPPDERRAEQTRMRRERGTALLRAEDLLSSARLDELEAMSDEAYFDFVRELTTPPRAPAQLSPVVEEMRERLETRSDERPSAPPGRDD